MLGLQTIVFHYNQNLYWLKKSSILFIFIPLLFYLCGCVSAGRGAPGALRLWSGCGTGAMEAKAGTPDIATAVVRSESAGTPL